MPKRPTVTIVGAGNFGSALAILLRRARYDIHELVVRDDSAHLRAAKTLATRLGAIAATLHSARLDAHLLWLAVPDDAVAICAADIRRRGFSSRFAFHSSGALASNALLPLRRGGAALASLHPLMSFVAGPPPSLKDVLFAVEGDRSAVSLARRIAVDLGGLPFVISSRNKPLYHAFGAFTSPLLIAHLAVAESLAITSGVPRAAARRAMRPIITRTLDNYFNSGAKAAFSGPLVRGDVATIHKHLVALKRAPVARGLYVALVNEALESLPVANRKRIAKLLPKP